MRDFETRETFRRYLDSKSVEIRLIFYPFHTMPMYSDKPSRFLVAENSRGRGLNLPSWPDLMIGNLEHIRTFIHGFFQN